MTAQILRKNKGLLKSFSEYKKRYLNVGKKPDIKKFLPADLYSTMRLEGEKITKKAAQVLFR